MEIDMNDFFPFLYKKEDKKTEKNDYLYLELEYNIDLIKEENKKEEDKVVIIEIL